MKLKSLLVLAIPAVVIAGAAYAQTFFNAPPLIGLVSDSGGGPYSSLATTGTTGPSYDNAQAMLLLGLGSDGKYHVCGTANPCTGGGGGGGGGLNTVAVGNLSPLFTSTVDTSTPGTAAVTYTASTAAANTVYCNTTGSAAVPAFVTNCAFNGANITALNASNLASGVINGARLPGTIAIGNVQVTLPTAAITAGTCTAGATATITGVTTTTTFTTAFATDPTAVTGYGAGPLKFVTWPTSNTLHWSLCNSGAADVTPGAMTMNVGVR